MQETKLSKNVKALRTRKGFSQEQLAEKSGLSLRTVQRIENGETEPRGDSLRRLADAFEALPNDLIEWTEKEDTTALQMLNYSSLFFLIFPLLGVIVPLIIWNSNKDKVSGINEVAKKVLNFQTSYVVLVFFLLIVFLIWGQNRIFSAGDVSPTDVADFMSSYLKIYLFLTIYNLVFVLINSWRIAKEKRARYFPAIPFMR